MKAQVLRLVFIWVALAGAAAPMDLMAPPPDLTTLLPFAAAPLDKPAVPVPDLAPPPVPVEMPPLLLAPIFLPAAERPMAYLPPPRTLPCVGAFFRVASDAVECGKSKFQKGDYEDATKVLESALRNTSDREILQQARYWLGETLVRLNKFEQADWMFRQAIADSAGLEYEVWSAHGGGWMALRLGHAPRAREMFAKVLAGAVPPGVDPWARHGLGLALYALGKHAEAAQVWAELVKRSVPSSLARDVAFWHGEALGRVGQYAEAESELRAFTQGGPHPLLDAGFVRLGWWALAGGRFAESAPAFKTYLSMPRAPSGPRETDWADAGLALALAGGGDGAGAVDALRSLTGRRSPLALPVSLRLVRSAVDAKRPADAQAVAQEVLGGNVAPGVRAWLLFMQGEALRADGNRDEARTQYDLAQKTEPRATLSQLSALQLARTNVEMREFSQAVTDLTGLLAQPSLSPEVRGAALILQGEAAYAAPDYGVAAVAFRRALVEFPQHPQSPAIRLALAWVALRQDKKSEARQLFTEFATTMPDHPAAVDALVLAAELATAAGDLETGRQLVERVIASYPMHPRTDLARLNRAIFMVRAGQVLEAQAPLRDWIARAPFPPLIGRAHAALATALLATSQPAEATREFAAARQEGVGAFATLGLGATAMAQARWDEAAKALAEARDSGTAPIAAAAEYGLAGVALQQGKLREFKQPAQASLEASPKGPEAPRLLYILTAIAVAEKDWKGALDTARTLVTQFPADEAADDALERVGSAAATVPVWPVVYDAYTLMRQRYPQSPFLDGTRLVRAEAQLETKRPEEARKELEPLAATPPADPRFWIMLARAREATGDRQGAVEAYSRAAKAAQGPAAARDAMLSQARLLALDKRWAEARAVLDPLLRSDDQAMVIQGAQSLGDSYRDEGDHLAAIEYYMTAGYLSPESAVGRRSLLAAAQSFAVLKQPESAAIVYKRLLAQSNLPADVSDAARQGLKALGR